MTTPVRLYDTLIAHFDLDALRALCLRVRVDYENLRGETRDSKAQALVEWAGRHDRQPELRERIVEMRPQTRRILFEDEGEPTTPPYLGLRTFEEADASFFFGRETLIAELIQKVAQAPFLAVLGPSGSGKSSVVRAGLIPALKNGALPGSEGWRYAIMKPGPRPLDTLAATLAQIQGSDVKWALTLKRMLASDEKALLMSAEMIRSDNPNTRLVLVVDQFEELWTQAPVDPNARRAFTKTEQLPFLELLLEGTTLLQKEARNTTPLLIIITLRADFLHRAAVVPNLARAIQEHISLIGPMTHEELRDVIEKPAYLAGASFEAGLVVDLLAEVEGRPGALPLLEYTLLELWKTRTRGVLTRAAYQALSGIEGALAARADTVLATRYNQAQRDELRYLLLRLVQPGEGVADTRRRAFLHDLVSTETDLNSIQILLQPLVEERLLTTGRDAITGEETVDLSHEALIRAWPTFRQWIDEARDDLRLHLSLEANAREWQRNQESTDLLWPALRLATAEMWLARARPRLSATELRFLQTSRIHQEARHTREEAARREHETLLEARAAAETAARREAEARATTGRRATILLLILFLVSVLFCGVALSGQRTSTQAAHRALRAEGTAQAEATRAIGAANAEAQARATAQIAAEQEGVARATAQAAANQAETEAQRARTLALAGEALFDLSQGETDRATHLAIAAITPVTDTYPILVSRTLRETLNNSHTLRIFRGHNNWVLSVAWSPDGQQVLTGSEDRSARVWEVASGTLLHTLAGHSGGIWSVGWSPDGQQVLTGSADGSVRLWDATSGTFLRTFREGEGGIRSVAWSPDGQQVLTGSDDGSVRIWEAKSGTLRHTLTGGGGSIRSVAWSPDGQFVLAGSILRTAYVWEAVTGTLVYTLDDHRSGVWSVAWSPDGQQILSGSSDGSARLWEAASGRLVRTLAGPKGAVRAVAWSPDGQQVLVGGDEGSVRLWEVASGALLHTLEGHIGGVTSVAWSPDGQQVLTGSDDGSARLWATTSDAVRRTLEGARSGINAVGWSPNGQLVIAGSNEGGIHLWNASSGTFLHTLEGGDWVSSVAWAPDGQRVAGGSGDGTVYLWNAVSGSLLHTLASQGNSTSVAWSPDGQQVLTGSDEGSAHLWDATSGTLLRTLAGHGGGITSLAWSPDGQYVLIGSAGGSLSLWEASTGIRLQTLDGHAGEVISVGWSSDGQHLQTSDTEGTFLLWETTSGILQHTLKISDSITSVAWSPDGQQVLVGSDDGMTRLWGTTNGKLLRILEGSGRITSVAWSPDGQQVITGSSDGTVTIWVASDRLIAATLIRRACTLFTDEEIRAAAPIWQGHCSNLLEAVKEDADAYERLRGP